MSFWARGFELSRGGEAHNLRAMEGLRGFAVLLVFFVHFVSLVEPWLAPHDHLLGFAQGLHAIGNTGVDLFFVLSGYLIYGALISRPQTWFDFMARRVRRIYPAFSCVFLAYVALSFAFPVERKIPSGWRDAFIYLLQNFLLLPGLFPIKPMITVAWSLSYEFFFYLVIPLLVTVFRLRERSSNWRVGFFLVVCLLGLAFYVFWGGHIRLIMFLAGIILFEALRRLDWVLPSSTVTLVIVLLALGYRLVPVSDGLPSALKALSLFFAFFMLCLVCFKNPTGKLAAGFSWTPLRWLGNMSYSYYLIHGLALKFGFLLVAKVFAADTNGVLLFWIALPAMFAWTLIPSAFLFLMVERRFSLPRVDRGSGHA